MGTGCSSERTTSMVQLNRDNIPSYKIVLIGDPGVGKTNVLLRYTKNQFDYSYRPTNKVTIENVVKKLNVPSNFIVSVTLWDLPGQEDMDLRSTYYKDVDAAIVVVDMSDEGSIDQVRAWRKDFLERTTRTQDVHDSPPTTITTNQVTPATQFNPHDVPMLLLGNKYDIVEGRMMEEEMEKMLKKEEEADPLKPISDALEAEERDREDQNNETDRDNANIKGNSEDLRNSVTDATQSEVRDDGTGEDRDDLIERDEEERELLFTEDRRQHPSGLRPPCVHKLLEMEKENGFIGSILVSAKEKDGTVDAAIQSLIRHLLDKSNIIPKQPKKPVEKKSKKNITTKVKKHGFQPLKKCGVEELDKLFERSSTVLRRVFDHGTFYDVALHKVRQRSADVGVITDSTASLEDCVQGMRKIVQDEMHRDIQLMEEGEFPKLHIEIDEDADKILIKQNKMFLKLMDDFHREYCAICQTIVREAPILVTLLDKLDTLISVKAEEMWESLEQREEGQEEKSVKEKEKARVEKLCGTCEKARARLAHARLKVQEYTKVVHTARDKIKAALLW